MLLLASGVVWSVRVHALEDEVTPP
jgi:hypothetical protein